MNDRSPKCPSQHHQQKVILDLWLRVRMDWGFAANGLAACLRQERGLHSQERRQVMESVFGLIRQARLLDYILPSLGRLPPPGTGREKVRYVAYQLLQGEIDKAEAKQEGEEAILLSQIAEVKTETVKPKRPKTATTRVARPKFVAEKSTRSAANRAPKKPVIPVKTPEELAQERKHEKIEELSAKIERQRQRAERDADTIVESDQPYAAQTREGLANADNAASKMDELRKRMESLRQTVNTREVVVTEKHTRTDSVSTNKSVVELQNEQATLKKHYAVLEKKLEQMAVERNDKSAAPMSKGTPTKPASANKFDENEVKAALASLKNAIADLQKQIDARRG